MLDTTLGFWVTSYQRPHSFLFFPWLLGFLAGFCFLSIACVGWAGERSGWLARFIFPPCPYPPCLFLPYPWLLGLPGFCPWPGLGPLPLGGPVIAPGTGLP